MLEAAERAAVRGMAMAIEADQAAKDELASHGMTIETASDQFMDQLRETAQPIIAQWVEQVGPDGQAIIDRYEELRSRLQQ